METNCYHIRDGQGNKLIGGMLHAATYEEAAERATHGLTVKLNSGPGVDWVNKNGKRVHVYLSIHPEHTKRGAALIATARKEREAQHETQRQKDEDTEQALQDAIDGVGGPEAALAKLKGEG